MSTDETYNGWTNRETWALALYINNDQGWQESVHEALREDLAWINALTSFGMPVEAAQEQRAGEVVKNHTEELFDYDTHEGIFTRDLFMAMTDIGSLYRVNWDEIGASFLADIAENA